VVRLQTLEANAVLRWNAFTAVSRRGRGVNGLAFAFEKLGSVRKV
jgi:hypothetical protein